MQRLHCTVENGIINLPTVDVKDGEYYFELKEVGVRSGQQNNYYWQIIDILSEELGYTKQEMHQTIKNHFDIIQVDNPLGVYRNSIGTPGGSTPDGQAKLGSYSRKFMGPCISILGHNSGQFRIAIKNNSSEKNNHDLIDRYKV